MTHTTSRLTINRHVIVGSAMMLVGLALLLDVRLDLRVNFWASGWAVLLFLAGVVRTIDPSTGDSEVPSRRTGVWLMTIGAWGFLSQNRLLGLSFKTSWPLLLVAAGIITVWWAIDEARRARTTEKDN